MKENDQLLADLARDRGRDLLAYAFLLTGEHAAAQDLVQDAFVKVFGRLRNGFTPDVAEAYVRRTIVTTYVDGFRRRKRWSAVQHLLASEATGGEPTGDRVDLHAALATLSPQERACVVLRFYEDLTVPALAARLGLADGTVKRYLSTAVHKLEHRLGPVDAPDVETLTVHPDHARS
jgi:RNA polymerase sigma factor (sigma-70 family)